MTLHEKHSIALNYITLHYIHTHMCVHISISIHIYMYKPEPQALPGFDSLRPHRSLLKGAGRGVPGDQVGQQAKLENGLGSAGLVALLLPFYCRCRYLHSEDCCDSGPAVEGPGLCLGVQHLGSQAKWRPLIFTTSASRFAV